MQTAPADQPTCGQGLAANAALPAKLAEVLSAQSEVLERHMRALDGGDSTAQRELEAYSGLVSAYRAAASQLSNIGDLMTSYRNLPMARHDLAVMAGPRGQMEAFQRFVALEQELVGLLISKLASEQELLQG